MKTLALGGSTRFLDENIRLAYEFQFNMAQCLRTLALGDLENHDVVQYSLRWVDYLFCCIHIHDDLSGFDMLTSWYHTAEDASDLFGCLAESMRLGLGGPWNDDQVPKTVATSEYIERAQQVSSRKVMWAEEEEAKIAQ